MHYYQSSIALNVSVVKMKVKKTAVTNKVKVKEETNEVTKNLDGSIKAAVDRLHSETDNEAK